ncbi:MAG: PorP/SprF family type IX secretion system membrane protein [bacterium]|nr:PorP/SprF family type IX secretion system membrane protein [bacterium]
MMRSYLLVLFIGMQLFPKAQDFHLSMYDAAPLFLNPASTGLIDTKMRAHVQYRNQWNAVAFKPFKTSLFSFDKPYKKWGFGGQITNMRAGVANYNVLQLLASASYGVPLDPSKSHNLSLGLQAGFTQKQLEYQLLSFDSQWSTSNGGSFDNSMPSNEALNGQAFYTEVVNFGALYYYAKQQARLNPFLGLSIFDLTKPKDSFSGGNSRLPRRYYMHAGIRVNVSEVFYLIPKVLIYTQAKIVQQSYSMDAGYFFKGEKFFALAGYSLRVKDASVIYGGLRKDNYIIKIAYDFNTSSLRGVSSGRGAYELTLTWLGRKGKTNELRNCPRL